MDPAEGIKDESKLDELISLKHTLNGLRGGLRLLGNTRIKLIIQ